MLREKHDEYSKLLQSLLAKSESDESAAVAAEAQVGSGIDALEIQARASLTEALTLDEAGRSDDALPLYIQV